MYNYSEFNDYNRFQNLDGVEGKILAHLIHSNSKYADFFWKILKYDDVNALNNASVTEDERMALVEGNGLGSEQNDTKVFFSPFVDDAWTKQTTSVYIYVDNIYPLSQASSDVSITIETVIHDKINMIISDADLLNHPDTTNPNDFYGDNTEEPSFIYKSRSTVLLKCILAELNGLYIDGIGYLKFNSNKSVDGDKISSKAEMNLFNRRSFFGHSIKFNVTISGVSESGEVGF